MNYLDIEHELCCLGGRSLECNESDKNKRFLSLVKVAINNSEFYGDLVAKHNVEVASIDSINEIGKLPLMDATVFSAGVAALTIDEKKIVRYCLTSGSTGEPKLIPYTRNDLANAIKSQTRSFIFSGVSEYEKCLCVMVYGPWASGLICQAAAEIIGLTIPAEVRLGIDYQLSAFARHRPDYIVCLPSFLPFLEKSCRDKKMDPAALGIRRIFLVGEIFSTDFRDFYETVFSATLVNMYANTEFGLIATQCSHKNMHVWDDLFHVEVISSETGLACADGEVGELVVTALQREALPLIRYNTHDLVQQHSGQCACGHQGSYFSDIKGRGDDMLVYLSGNIYPIQIEEAVTSVEGLCSYYQCVIEKIDHRDHFLFRLEVSHEMTAEQKRILQTVFLEKLLNSDPVFKLVFAGSELTTMPSIEILSPGELSRQPGKMKKIIDRRVSTNKG